MRAAVEEDLGTTAKRVVKAAERTGWALVGVVSTDVVTGETVLSLRGRRGADRFVVVLVDGKVDGCWWWTREHSAVVKGHREVEKTTRVNAWTVSIGKKLEHDPELDEVVTWTSDCPSWERLASLSELVGVASRGVAGLLDSSLTHE